MKEKREYDVKNNLGLDIGTNSIGMVVMDDEYNICRKNNKDLAFVIKNQKIDTSKKAKKVSPTASRRLKRGARRRLDRMQERIDNLQMLFSEEINKEDPSFFARLNESKFHYCEDESKNDKSVNTKHIVYTGDDYSDVDFYKKYPTIYHLRYELISNPEKHNIKEYYLALHHITKNRGHFLISGNLENANIEKTCKRFSEEFENYFSFQVKLDDNVKDIITSDISKNKKAKMLQDSITFGKKGVDKKIQNKRNACLKEICKLIVGNKGDFRKIFFDVDFSDIEIKSITFSEDSFEKDIFPEFENAFFEESLVINALYSLYSAGILAKVLDSEEYLSAAKVKTYNTHKENLAMLKQLVKKYCSNDQYKDFFDFNGNKKGYSGYIGNHISKKKCSKSDFYKELRGLLKSITPDLDDMEKYEYIVAHAEGEDLLPKLRSKENSTIPIQVHEKELDMILENLVRNYPSFGKIDETGFTVSERIKNNFVFKRPYYCGVFDENSPNSWIVKKASGKITPDNFEQLVDLEKTNEAFIERQTNNCTYIPWETVLPKNSLLYQRYMVLNELNNVKVKEKPISLNQKKAIFEDLFEEYDTVTRKRLLNYLKKDDPSITDDDITGFDGDFKATLSSYRKLKKIIGDKVDTEPEMCEDVINITTIHNDSDIISGILERKYDLSDDEINKLKRLRFNGWGTLSKTLLEDLQGTNIETGEIGSIMHFLWETNDNLMQLMSSRYDFDKRINEMKKEKYSDDKMFDYRSFIDQLNTSPANKKNIALTIKSVKELVKIIGCVPKNFYIETTRSHEKSERTISRKQRLINAYDKIIKTEKDSKLLEEAKEFKREIESHNESYFMQKKVYLYYSQMGRCAYTGNKINIKLLNFENAKWDKDHIYPKSKVRDDSFDNLVLAEKEKNGEKDDALVPERFQNKMRKTWKYWCDNDLISREKYERLIRTKPLSSKELDGFAAVQIVETAQIIKEVKNILERLYPESKVYLIKAKNITYFRSHPLNVLKSRTLNDYHHAVDAYLCAVVGRVYNVRFTNNYKNWHKKGYWNMYKIFDNDIEGVWEGLAKTSDGKLAKNENDEVYGGTIDRIRKNIKTMKPIYTETVSKKTGEFFNATLASPKESPKLPLKENEDPNKYGGYKSVQKSYFSMIKYDNGKERVKEIIGVPIYIAEKLKHDKNAFIKYCESLGKKDVEIILPVIYHNTLFIINGMPFRIAGDDGKNLKFKNNLQFELDDKNSEIVRQIEKFIKKSIADVSNYPTLNEENLLGLYDEFAKKLKGPYKNRPANQYDNLIKKRPVFVGLKAEEKIKVLFNVLNFFSCNNTTTSDLSGINCAPDAGKISINKNTLMKSDFKIIRESVTGFFRFVLFESSVK